MASEVEGDRPRVAVALAVAQDEEKGEGSLSIFIVPIESWKISPMKASE